MNDTFCNSPLPQAERLSRHERTSLIVLHCLATPITLLFNGFLIYALWKTKDYRRQFPRYILALSVSDICSGLFIQPLLIAYYASINQGTVNCTLSWSISLLSYGILNLTPALTLVIAADRFIRLKGAAVEECRDVIHKVNLLIIAAVCFSVAIPICTIVAVKTGMFCYYQMCLISVNFLVCCCIACLYMKTWWDVKKKKALRSRASNDKQQKKNITSQRPIYDQKMTRTITAILICLFTLYPAYLTVSIIRSIHSALHKTCDENSTLHLYAFFFTFSLLFINSFLNSFLYSYNNRKVKNLFFAIIFKNDKVSNAVSNI